MILGKQNVSTLLIMILWMVMAATYSSVCRSAGWKQNDSCLFPGWRDICWNCSFEVLVSDGRQWDRIYYSHNQTDQRDQLDKVSDGSSRGSVILNEPCAAGGHQYCHSSIIFPNINVVYTCIFPKSSISLSVFVCCLLLSYQNNRVINTKDGSLI